MVVLLEAALARLQTWRLSRKLGTFGQIHCCHMLQARTQWTQLDAVRMSRFHKLPVAKCPGTGKCLGSVHVQSSGTLGQAADGCRIVEVGCELLGGGPWIATAAAHRGAVTSWRGFLLSRLI